MKKRIFILCIASTLAVVGCEKKDIESKNIPIKATVEEKNTTSSKVTPKDESSKNIATENPNINSQVSTTVVEKKDTVKVDTPAVTKETPKASSSNSNPKTSVSTSTAGTTSKSTTSPWSEAITGEASPNNFSDYNLIVKQGDWLYYFDIWTKDLIKIKVNGSSKTILKHANIVSIAIKDNYIYYTLGDQTMRRIKTDGNGDEFVTYYAWQFNIVGDKIYFSNFDNIQVKDSQGVRLLYVAYGREREMTVLDNKIYYVNRTDGESIYRMNLDGSMITRIGGTKTDGINKYNDYIYYINGDDNGRIYAVEDVDQAKTKPYATDWSTKIYRFDNAERPRKVTNDSALWPVVSKGWIYYSNASDSNKLYKIMVDGTGRTKLNDEFSANIKVIGDWIFYTSKGTCHIIKNDGTHKYKL